MKRLIVSMVLGLSMISSVKAEEKEISYRELAGIASEYVSSFCYIATDKGLSKKDKDEMLTKLYIDTRMKYPELTYLSPDKQAFYNNKTETYISYCRHTMYKQSL